MSVTKWLALQDFATDVDIRFPGEHLVTGLQILML